MTLADKYIAPPISVLDVKQSYWKRRRNMWKSLGIRSEVGRSDNLLKMSELMQIKQSGTSIFDPVLCEVLYLWFTRRDDKILDPFSGGSVRGIVASKMGRRYEGIDLREEQVRSNQSQADLICRVPKPIWLIGNALDVGTMVKDDFDFFFTCPPYFDLEVYSDLNDDFSNYKSYRAFLRDYGNVIRSAYSRLKNNRFAAIVVGDIRSNDENGSYRGFVRDTINVFEKAGFQYYNDLVLLQEPATAAMRSNGFMESSRKIAKTHQNVLVFVKGSAKEATDRLGDIEVDYSIGDSKVFKRFFGKILEGTNGNE